MNQTKISDLDSSFTGLPARMTEVEFAKLVGVNQSVVSRLLSRGTLTRGAGWRTWVQELHRHTAEVAAGRRGEGLLDLVQERAQLAKVQAEKTEFELKKLRSEFFPKNLIINFMTLRFAIVRGRLLGLPSRIKSILPELPVSAFIKMTELIREILQELAHDRMPHEIREKLKTWVERGEDSQVKKKSGREINSRQMEAVLGH